MSIVPARWWHRSDHDRVQCDLCPRDCRLAEGQRGFCFVRQRAGDSMVLTTYGQSSGFCVDPIEKKPLAHFHPGSSVLSFGTAGCNLACRFCQNWEISKSRETEKLASSASPADIARKASELGCRSVAYTYNDPVIFAEYAMDTADACHALGIASVAVTAGYIHEEPRVEFFSKMDAANVDLKGFTERFYKELCAASLSPVKDTLKYLVHHTSVWTEITTLVIPGWNDSPSEIREMAEWIGNELSPTVPLHLSAFHPDFRMLDLARTPPETLIRARNIAREVGLKHVYTGNIHDADGDITRCSACDAVLIRRDWYDITEYRLDAKGCCPDCGHALEGRIGTAAGRWGRRRLPVSMR